jgi:WD40 repeat protein
LFDAFSIWDTATWQHLWELPGSAHESLYSPGWSTDGRYLAISGELDSDIRVLDAASGQVLTRIDSDQLTKIHLRNQSWAPQVDRFITGCTLSGSGDATACVWDAASGKVLLELPEQEGYILASTYYSPDGRYIATVSLTGILQVWEAGSGQPVSPQVNLSGSVTDMHWSPNGKRIGLGVSDVRASWVIVLDVMAGAQVASYPVSLGAVPAVDWSPDGKSLLVMSEKDPQPYIFPAWQTTEELIAYARECCAWRELTAEERLQFGLP